MAAVLTLLLILPAAVLAAALSRSVAIGWATALTIVLAWRKPAWLLIALTAAAPFLRSGNSAKVPPELLAQAKVAAMLLLGAVMGLRHQLSRPALGLPGPAAALLAAWTGLTGLAILHAADPHASLAYLPLTLAGVASFWMSFHQGRGTRRRLVAVILGTGAALGALVVLQYAVVTRGVAPYLARFIIEPRTQAYFAGHPLPEMTARFRPTGTMFHPNSMGLYFAVLLPFAAALTAARDTSGRARLLATLAAGVMALGLVATNSRGATVAALTAFGFLGLHRGYRRLWMAAAAALVIAGAGWVLAGRDDSLWRTLSGVARVQYGLSGRPVVWGHAIDLIRQTPFLGVGPANFSPQYVGHFGFFIPNSVDEQMSQIWTLQNLRAEKVIENFHAHNLYLQLAGEVGLLGPLLFLATLAWLLARGERTARLAPPGSARRALALGMAAWAVALAVYGVFDSQYAFTVDSVNLVAGPLLAAGLRGAL